MKNILHFFLIRIKNFFVNPFWKSLYVIGILIISFALNGLIWFFYWKSFKQALGLTPIVFSSSVILLNLILSNTTFKREPLITYILLGTSMLIQVFIFTFMELMFKLGGF